LHCYENRISDLTPLLSLQSLEKLSIAENPVGSFRVLEELPKLRELTLSTAQIARFVEVKCLRSLLSLDVTGDKAINDFTQWPDMPSLKVLDAHGMKNLKGIERFTSLQTLRLYGGKFTDLVPVSKLKRLAFLVICNSKPLDVESLAQLHALRYLSVNCPKVRGLDALSSLPVLHQIRMDDESSCETDKLSALRGELTSWDTEFRTDAKSIKPSLDLQVVDQETFDFYDGKGSYGVLADECNDGMLGCERSWLVGQMHEVLSLDFEKETDFVLPYTSGTRRSERVVLYSIKAYESFRNIVLAVQKILCETRNDWIVWFQSCLGEGMDMDEVPEGMEDFIVWIYPNKIVATKENAKIVRKLIDWQGSAEA
jgi:hypothetical protein